MSEIAKNLTAAAACGVYHLGCEPYEIEREAREAGLAFAKMDIGHVHHKEELTGHFATAMSFPAHFGRNWDALRDCLGDLSWMPADGYVVVLEKSKHFGAGHRHDFDTALEVFKGVCDEWRGRGKPFWLFIHGAQGWDSGLPRWPAA
jgi:RNAse (barnase) inhibitor barstar